jgi:mannonate dehydratase
MFDVAEFLEPVPSPFWTQLKQIGVNQAVGTLEHGEVGIRNWLVEESLDGVGLKVRPTRNAAGAYSWEYAELKRLKQQYEAAGFRMAVLEDNPPMDRIRLGLDGRDEEIEWFRMLVRNLGKLEVPVLSYSFMSVFDWIRTSVAERGRGGALVSSYDHDLMRDAPLTAAGVVSSDGMWANFKYFLERVIPAAEEAHVRLALHPDDPPLSPVRGLSRIMCTLDALQQAVDLVPSEYNGLTFCQGNVTLMTNNVPEAIRRFGEQDKIFYVHFRDVRGTPDHFIETFQDDGQTNMLECMRAYREIGFKGVMRSDHVPTLEGDSHEKPGYSSLGRLFAVGYMIGLREAVFAQEERIE